VFLAADRALALKVLEGASGEIQVVVSNVVIPPVGSRTRYIFTGARLSDAVVATLSARTGTILLPKPWSISDLDRKVKELLTAPAKE
jgi:hypothetical protein